MTGLDLNLVRGIWRGHRLLLLCLLLWVPTLYAEGRVMVLWAEAVTTPPGPGLLAEVGSATGLELTWIREVAGRFSLLEWRAGAGMEEAEALERLVADPRIKAVQADRRRRLQYVPNDSLYADQWYLFDAAGINAQAAWDLQRGSTSVVVAVLDTGILPHEDINAARVLPGYDFHDWNADPTDPGDTVTDDVCGDGTYRENSSWHGLKVAGVLMATADNGIGIAGVDHRTRLLPVRVSGQCGALLSDILDAMRWAVGLSVPGVPTNPHPAQVINLSLGADAKCNPSFEQPVIDEVIAHGAVVVVAAGNEATDAANASPASCRGVITVAAVTRAGKLASYSNYGSAVDISAPGGQMFGIMTTTNLGATAADGDGYTDKFVGTSFSTPQVAGVLALLRADRPTATVSQLRQALLAGAKPFPDSSCNTSLCGAGLLDAQGAILALRALPEPTSGGGGGGGCVQAGDSRPEALWWLGLAWVLYRFARRNDCAARRV
ncbi:MAG: S8 family serine peptidase [Gammaproteobacteria bacterium]|nr:S8 family serine peptidase [Gammaproteobacteria bacterium]